VEYYDSIGDRKNSQLYTEKMQFVFMKPHISKLFMPRKPSPKKRSKSPPKVKTPIKNAPSNEQSLESKSENSTALKKVAEAETKVTSITELALKIND
jgi:hypothetical protein